LADEQSFVPRLLATIDGARRHTMRAHDRPLLADFVEKLDC
jgi:hypothetical protein